MDYPTWAPGIGGGVIIGMISIVHVLVSHFAVGGGIAMAVVESLAVFRRDVSLRALARRSSTMLILVSTVFGAISGVGIWFSIGLVAPSATSALIRNFAWGWAIEWTFFLLEVATALTWAATWDRVRPRTHLLFIWLYAFAAFMSLVVIQGILAFMLTPGRWLETHLFWDGLFNPSYLSGLVLRIGTCLLLAGSYLALAAQREKDARARGRMVRLLAVFQVVGSVVALASFPWWQRAALPGGLEAVFAGAASTLQAMRWTVSLARAGLGAALVLSFWAVLRPRWHRWPTAVVTLLAAFVFLGGYERVREGARKPFVIHDWMFSNGIRVDQVPRLNARGILTASGWASRAAAVGNLEAGEQVFRIQCSSCHTRDGYNSIRTRLGAADPDRIAGLIGFMRADAEVWAAALKGDTAPSGGTAGAKSVDRDQLTYPYMPPLVGTEEDAAALAEFLLHAAGGGLASEAGRGPARANGGVASREAGPIGRLTDRSAARVGGGRGDGDSVPMAATGNGGVR
jgi:cytochrome bd ubiquinol oxidase subunit I